MEIHARRVDDVTVFDLAGDLILGQSAESLRARLHAELEGGARGIAVSLEKVNYIDSYGAGTILAVHTSAINAGARCNFFGAPERVTSILKVLRLDKVLNLFPNEATALSNLWGNEPRKAVAS